MIKRFISVCSVVIWLFGLYGCAQTGEGTTVAETEAESEDFQIYKYLSDDGTAIYMRTEDDEIQIFTSDEYCIDHENGVLFLVERNEYDYFISISQYCAVPVGECLKISRIEILSDVSIEELVSEAYGHTLSDTEENFYVDSAYVTALEEKQAGI